MLYCKNISNHTYEVKQSKFIAHLLPIQEYETTLELLKQMHPKARHFVTAWRYINEYEQIIEHSSDDGEPKGTSGKPTLMVLQGKELINTAVIVVRYFGGTKLGTGGLVRAYSESVNGVLCNTELFEYQKKVQKSLVIEYADLRFIEYECEAFGVDVVEKNFDREILWRIEAIEQNMESFLEKVRRVVRVL
jgi:uncharacterized YigZ family protein